MGASPHNKFVLTGGPGLGKSALLVGLRSFGFEVYPEAARVILDEWRASGSSSPTPFEARERFDAAIAARMVQDYDAHGGGQPAIYDRGLPDLLAWGSHLRRPTTALIERLVRDRPYERMAFITPEWAPWYQRDEDRPFDLEESLEINRAICHTYAALGYELTELPRASIAVRIQFIFASIKRYQGGRLGP